MEKKRPKKRTPKKPLLTEVKDRYLEVKYQIRLLEAEAGELQDDLKARMIRGNKKKLKGTRGLVTLSTRVTTVYPESVRKEIRDIKEKAEKGKKVTYDTTTYLQVRLED